MVVNYSAYLFLSLLEAGGIKELLQTQVNEGGGSLIAVAYFIPFIMAWLSLTLKDSANRWTNLVLGILFAVLFILALIQYAVVGRSTTILIVTFFGLVENIVVDRRLADGQRFRRVMPNQRIAKIVDARIAAKNADGSWRQLREELTRGQEAKKVTFDEFSERYIEDYCKLKNRAWQRKRDSIRALSGSIGDKALEDINPSDLDKYFKQRKRIKFQTLR